MEYTDYGKKMAEAEPLPEPHPLGGATAHMAVCGYDAGIEVLLTGHDARGRKFNRSAKSVFGAFMIAKALWGVERAWHRREDGTRRLLFKR